MGIVPKHAWLLITSDIALTMPVSPTVWPSMTLWATHTPHVVSRPFFLSVQMTALIQTSACSLDCTHKVYDYYLSGLYWQNGRFSSYPSFPPSSIKETPGCLIPDNSLRNQYFRGIPRFLIISLFIYSISYWASIKVKLNHMCLTLIKLLRLSFIYQVRFITASPS